MNQSDINQVNELIEAIVANITMEADRQAKAPLYQDAFLTESSLKNRLHKVSD